MVGLLETMMTSVIIDGLTDSPSKKNTEWREQGIANIIAGFFGGMAGWLAGRLAGWLAYW